VIDFYRKHKPVAEINQQEPGNLPFPEAVVVEHEQLTQITKALRELGPEYQQIIILRLVNELSHRDAAMIMKISEGHSRILLYRALRKLRTILDENDGSYA
jgi:RNA polymerase sigma factor (sigma-70 family)